MKTSTLYVVLAVLTALLCNNSNGSTDMSNVKALEKEDVCETGYDYFFGYYQPNDSFRVGKFVFKVLALGDREGFQKYEAGKGNFEDFAPFLLEFNDVTSKKRTNETGVDYYEKQIRVLPKDYEVTATTLTFYGTDKQLGDVKFNGKINPKDLRIAKGEIEMQREPVLIGDLTFAGRTFKNVEFSWFGGD